MNSNQKGPLTPQDLFNRLISTDFREVECVDEYSRLRQQKEILIQLILQYEEEIRKVNQIAFDEQELNRLKQKLLIQLEALRNERGIIQARIAEQIEILKVSPVEMRDHASWVMEINEARGRNNKLRIRIKDLMGYISKLQVQNKRLEDQRRIISANEMARRQSGQNWKIKIDTLQKEHLSYQYELRQKIKDKEQVALKNIQSQQLQIKQRNRQRMQSFKKDYTPYKNIQNRQFFQDNQSYKY